MTHLNQSTSVHRNVKLCTASIWQNCTSIFVFGVVILFEDLIIGINVRHHIIENISIFTGKRIYILKPMCLMDFLERFIAFSLAVAYFVLIISESIVSIFVIFEFSVIFFFCNFSSFNCIINVFKRSEILRLSINAYGSYPSCFPIIFADTITSRLEICKSSIPRIFTVCAYTQIITSVVKWVVMTSLSQREYKVQMPFDDETALIDLDKRFMLEIINGEPKTYVTTSVDQSTERYELHGKTQGFLVLNIRQDQYNSKTDNAEKMICDYFEPNKSDEPDADSQVTATIKYAGKPEVRVGGSWKKFTPVFTSITGEEVAEVAKWSFICLDEFKSFVETQVATNDVFKIRILNNSIMDGATVRISLTNADDTANTSIECKVVSLL